MNRSDLQRLAGVRLREAKVLFVAGEYSGAYYLAGYAVECGLKACIAKGTRRYDFPDRERVSRSFVHNPTELVKLAELFGPLQVAMRSNPALESKLEHCHGMVREEPL